MKINEKDATFMTIRDPLDEPTAEDSLAVRRMLGLDPTADEISVAYASIARNDRELAILSRSILEVIMILPPASKSRMCTGKKSASTRCK